MSEWNFYGRILNRRLRILVVTSTDVQGDVKGGNQLFAEKLADSINTYTPHHAELYMLPFRENLIDVFRSYFTALRKRADDYDIVFSIKFPSYCIRHPCHISLLNHRWKSFYSLWDERYGRMPLTGKIPMLLTRSLIHVADRQFLKRKRILSQSETIRKRLEKDGLRAEVLYPPSLLENPKTGKYSYFLLPGRHDEHTKRISLAIRAMKLLEGKTKLIITGAGRDTGLLKRLAGRDKRIIFTGYVDDRKLKELYADALAVIFTPVDEDYGLVTIDAFKSRKPVITCSDSGGPTEFVRNLVNGFVIAPNSLALARTMQYFADNPREARKMGNSGYELVKNITWKNYVKGILGRYADNTGPQFIDILAGRRKTAGNWDEIRRLSFYHGLAHVVYERCHAHMPKKTREQFEAHLFKQEAINRQFFRTFDELQQLLRGVRYMPLKGITKRMPARQMADIDILVHRDDFSKTFEILKRDFVPILYSPRNNIMKFTSPSSRRIVIEVKSKAFPPMNIEYDDLENASEETFFCLEVAHSLYRHNFQGLRWIYESYKKYYAKIDINKCVKTAKNLKMDRLLEVYAYIVKVLFGWDMKININGSSVKKANFLLSLHDFITPLEGSYAYEYDRMARIILSDGIYKIREFYRAFVPPKTDFNQKTIQNRKRDIYSHMKNFYFFKNMVRALFV